MTVPVPSVCPMCDGDGILGTVEDNYPCPQFSMCVECGAPEPSGRRLCDYCREDDARDWTDDDYRHKVTDGSR